MDYSFCSLKGFLPVKDVRVGDWKAAARAVGRRHAEGAPAGERHPLPARLARRPALAAPPAHRLLCASTSHLLLLSLSLFRLFTLTHFAYAYALYMSFEPLFYFLNMRYASTSGISPPHPPEPLRLQTHSAHSTRTQSLTVVGKAFARELRAKHSRAHSVHLKRA